MVCIVMETIRISVMVSILFIYLFICLFYFIFESDLTAFAFVGVSLLDKKCIGGVFKSSKVI